MKIKTCLLLIIAMVVCVPAFGHVGYPWSADEKIPYGQTTATLAGIDKLYVFIVPSNEPNENGTLWQELDGKVKAKLEAAGMKVSVVLYAGVTAIPKNPVTELRVEVNMLKLADSAQCVFNVRTSLALPVFVKNGSAISAEVWQVSAMEVTAEEEMSTAISTIVLGQVDKFIKARAAANVSRASSVNTGGGAGKVAVASVAAKKVSAAERNYVASKNSKVFHNPDCSSAKSIKSENLVTYVTREQAISDGKRPCKTCKP